MSFTIYASQLEHFSRNPVGVQKFEFPWPGRDPLTRVVHAKLLFAVFVGNPPLGDHRRVGGWDLRLEEMAQGRPSLIRLRRHFLRNKFNRWRFQLFNMDMLWKQCLMRCQFVAYSMLMGHSNFIAHMYLQAVCLLSFGWGNFLVKMDIGTEFWVIAHWAQQSCPTVQSDTCQVSSVTCQCQGVGRRGGLVGRCLGLGRGLERIGAQGARGVLQVSGISCWGTGARAVLFHTVLCICQWHPKVN